MQLKLYPNKYCSLAESLVGVGGGSITYFLGKQEVDGGYKRYSTYKGYKIIIIKKKQSTLREWKGCVDKGWIV